MKKTSEEVVDKLFDFLKEGNIVYGAGIHQAVAPDMELKKLMRILKLFYDRKLILGHTGVFPCAETMFENTLFVATPSLCSSSRDSGLRELFRFKAKEVLG